MNVKKILYFERSDTYELSKSVNSLCLISTINNVSIKRMEKNLRKPTNLVSKYEIFFLNPIKSYSRSKALRSFVDTLPQSCPGDVVHPVL